MRKDRGLISCAGLFASAMAAVTNVTMHSAGEGLCFDKREMCAPMLPSDYDRPGNDEPLPLHRINPLSVAVSTSIGPSDGTSILAR